jgi:hypothetical protein
VSLGSDARRPAIISFRHGPRTSLLTWTKTSCRPLYINIPGGMKKRNSARCPPLGHPVPGRHSTEHVPALHRAAPRQAGFTLSLTHDGMVHPQIRNTSRHPANPQQTLSTYFILIFTHLYSSSEMNLAYRFPNSDPWVSTGRRH